MRYGIKVPDLIINGLNSEFLKCEMAPLSMQNFYHDLRWDVYTNGYGSYWVYEDHGQTYVRPRKVTIVDLPKYWKLNEDSKIVIIDHAASTYIGQDPILENYAIYENTYGQYNIYTDENGVKMVREDIVYNPDTQPYLDPRWRLDEDYKRDCSSAYIYESYNMLYGIKD